MHSLRRSITAVILASASLCVGNLDAQQTPITFRSAAVSVTLDVIVTEKNDAPVDDLRAEDFEIRQAGRLQRVTRFEHVVIKVDGHSANSGVVPQAIVDVATNVKPAAESRAFVFVVGVAANGFVQRTMTEFFKLLSPQDRIALVFIGQSARSQDFTTDTARLTRALSAPPAYDMDRDHLRATIDVLENALTALDGAPETRKAVVYVSRGLPVALTPPTRDASGRPMGGMELAQARSKSLDVMSFFNQARDAGIPVYTLDPDPTTTVTRVGSLADVSREFLMNIASATGGIGYTNQDPISAVRRMVMDNSDYYVLSFAPDPFEADSKFHEVKVSVPARTDVHIRSRPGYVARPPIQGAITGESLLRTLENGQPGGDLMMRAVAATLAPSAKGGNLVLTVEADYPGPATRDTDELKLAIIALDLQGRILASETKSLTVPVKGRQSPFSVTFNESLDFPIGTFSARIGASSEMLGQTGVVHLPVEVPDFKKEPVLTPIIVGLIDDTNVIAQRSAIERLVPFQPTARRVFAPEDRVQIYARAVNVEVKSTRVQATIVQGNKTIRVLFPAVAPISDTRAAEIRLQDPLKDLKAGPYVLQLSLRSGNQKPIVQSVPFTVR